MSADDKKSRLKQATSLLSIHVSLKQRRVIKEPFPRRQGRMRYTADSSALLKEMDISSTEAGFCLHATKKWAPAASGLPEADEFLSVDMGCIGDDLSCDETMVSICVKDSGAPYDLGIVSKLVRIAKNENISYACDVYPYYGSDANAAVRAGYHMRHGRIYSGIYASHGYERGHRDGFENTLKLIIDMRLQIDYPYYY